MSTLNTSAEARRDLAVQGMWTPARQGYQAWTTPPDACSGTIALASGRLYLSALDIDDEFAGAAVDYYVSVVATTPTADQCLVGLYDADGVLVASADAVTAFGEVGTHSLSLTGITITPQSYRFAILFNGSTGPQIPRSATGAGGPGFTNLGLSAGGYRAAYQDSKTALPDPISYSANSAYVPLLAAIRSA